jgi:hypothetical protein
VPQPQAVSPPPPAPRAGERRTKPQPPAKRSDKSSQASANKNKGGSAGSRSASEALPRPVARQVSGESDHLLLAGGLLLLVLALSEALVLALSVRSLRLSA